MLPRLQTTTKPQTFSDTEKDSVGYFFLRLANIYGATKMQTQWPDDESLKLAKREYGKSIGQYSREDLNEAFELTKRERQIGNDRFDWPNIDAIIGLISNEGVMTGSWGTGAHRLWKPENLIGQGTEKGKKKAANKALGEMKGMFD